MHEVPDRFDCHLPPYPLVGKIPDTLSVHAADVNFSISPSSEINPALLDCHHEVANKSCQN
jgi:hypothetical protein